MTAVHTGIGICAKAFGTVYYLCKLCQVYELPTVAHAGVEVCVKILPMHVNLKACAKCISTVMQHVPLTLVNGIVV